MAVIPIASLISCDLIVFGQHSRKHRVRGFIDSWLICDKFTQYLYTLELAEERIKLSLCAPLGIICLFMRKYAVERIPDEFFKKSYKISY